MLNPRVRAFFVGGLLLLLLPVSMTHAQRFQPFGPLDFTQDWQPFAPAEIKAAVAQVAQTHSMPHEVAPRKRDFVDESMTC